MSVSWKRNVISTETCYSKEILKGLWAMLLSKEPDYNYLANEIIRGTCWDHYV